MCSTVLFSLTESRTSFHAPPCSLKTSFCGSVNRIAVSCRWMFIVLSCSIVVCPNPSGDRDPWCHHFTTGTHWTSPPILPNLSFRYTQDPLLSQKQGVAPTDGRLRQYRPTEAI